MYTEILEEIAQISCGIATLGFIFVASVSRSRKAETILQNIVVVSCLLSMCLLFWLWSIGGEMWGSDAILRPLALICLVIAITAKMNLKGTNISFGANPHNISRNRLEEE